MLRTILAVAVALCSCAFAEARGRRHVQYQQSAPQAAPACCGGTIEVPQDAFGSIAQAKAEQQAAACQCFHPGGPYAPGASAEGCGYSSVGPDDAIRHCCFFGQRPLVAFGVARGSNGWYATCHYR